MIEHVHEITIIMSLLGSLIAFYQSIYDIYLKMLKSFFAIGATKHRNMY